MLNVLKLFQIFCLLLVISLSSRAQLSSLDSLKRISDNSEGLPLQKQNASEVETMIGLKRNTRPVYYNPNYGKLMQVIDTNAVKKFE